MQLVFRFLDPKIPALSFEVGSVKDGQFVPVDNVQKFIDERCSCLKQILNFNTILGSGCFLHMSAIGDALDQIRANYSVDKFEFYPTFIVLTINSFDHDQEPEKEGFEKR